MSAKRLSFTFSTRDDGTNVLDRHTKFLGKFTLPNVSSGIAGTNFFDLLIAKAGLWVSFTMRMATLLAHVSKIVLDCAKKQMSGIDAAGIVAAMANKSIGGKIAIMQFIGNTMRLTALVTTQFDLAVPFTVKRALPFPALVGAAPVNLLPKAFRDGAMGGGLMAGYVFSLPTWVFGDGDKLTATAFAKNSARVMICHVDTFLSRFGHSRGRFQRRSAISIGLLPEYFTTIEAGVQYVYA